MSRQDEVSILQIVNAFLRHRRLAVLVPLVTSVIVVAWAYLAPPEYTSTASFTPQSSNGEAEGRLVGLASQFGVSLPSRRAGQTPTFYADLLLSRALLKETVTGKYTVESQVVDGAQTSDLVRLFEIEADSRSLAVEAAVRYLRQEVVGVTTDAETGVVELSVRTPWAALSQQVAETMLDLVNRFNVETRRSQAEAERGFIEDQREKAERALLAAEDSLERFLERNRRYQNSPRLVFEHDRLQRRVSLQQQLYTSLSQSYQQARINEVRSTPVITVVEPPELPAAADERRLGLQGALGLLLGGVIVIFWVFAREILSSSKQAEPNDYAEFTRLKSEATNDVRRLWYWLRRRPQ